MSDAPTETQPQVLDSKEVFKVADGPDLNAERNHFRKMRAALKEKDAIDSAISARQAEIVKEKASQYPEVGGNYEAARQLATRIRAEANKLHKLAETTRQVPPGYYEEVKSRRDNFAVQLVQEEDVRDNWDAYGAPMSNQDETQRMHIVNCITIAAGIQALDEWLEANKSAAS